MYLCHKDATWGGNQREPKGDQTFLNREQTVDEQRSTLIQTLLICQKTLASNPPDWVGNFPQWDETRHKLKYNVDKPSVGRSSLSTAKREYHLISQSTEVMVQKKIVSWGWSDAQVEKRCQPHYLELILPPVSLPSTTGVDILNGLRMAYYSKPAWEFIGFLLTDAVEIWGPDGSQR